MINHQTTRRCFRGLRMMGLLYASICLSPVAAGTPPGLESETPALVDHHSQSPRLQAYSRAGARFEMPAVGTITQEGSSVGDDVDVDVDDDDVALSHRVDINSASAEELAAALPGIGPSKAQGIVEWRELNGPFRTVEQLLEVSGIGPRTLEKIRPYVHLGDSLSLQRKESELPPDEVEVVLALSAIIQRADRDRRQALLLSDTADR